MIFLAFVVPLAIYCLVLSVINRRSHPVLVPGPWDFAGVLFAASGFLLLGGPAMLTGIYEHWRISWLLGPRYLQGIAENWSFWISLWLLYFVIIAGASTIVLWRRRAQTSIYNVEPDVLAEVLAQVLDRLGLEWHQSGPRRMLLRFREHSLEGAGSVRDPILGPQRTAVAAQGVSTSASPWVVLTVEPFPVMRHVTFHWLAHDEAVRLEVETELAKALAQVHTRPNSVGAWFLLISMGLFFSAFLMLLVLLVMRILQLPR